MQTIGVVNDGTTRARLSGPAVKGFLRLAHVWRLRTDEQIDLLGASVSRGTLRNWETGGTSPTLDADQLMRISYLLGIYEGLQRIWRRAPEQADAWIRRSRSEGPFGGRSPLDYMREGGILALDATRAYIDFVTGGPPSRHDYRQPPGEGL